MLLGPPGRGAVFEALGEADGGLEGGVAGQQNRREATSLKVVFLGLFGGQRLELVSERQAGAFQRQPVGAAARDSAGSQGTLRV